MSLFLLFMAIINKWLIVVLMCIPFPIFPSRGMHCVPNPFINCKMSPALLYDCNSAFMQFIPSNFSLPSICIFICWLSCFYCINAGYHLIWYRYPSAGTISICTVPKIDCRLWYSFAIRSFSSRTRGFVESSCLMWDERLLMRQMADSSWIIVRCWMISQAHSGQIQRASHQPSPWVHRRWRIIIASVSARTNIVHSTIVPSFDPHHSIKQSNKRSAIPPSLLQKLPHKPHQTRPQLSRRPSDGQKSFRGDETSTIRSINWWWLIIWWRWCYFSCFIVLSARERGLLCF